DDQIKIRGFRVELSEIEAELSRHPGVGETVVIAREDQPGVTRLVAYLVPEFGAVLDTTELQTRLAVVLPDYMLPSAFMVLDELPLSRNGKLDRRALPAPDFSEARGGYVAPRTESEKVVAKIWADVLGLDRVGVEDNFFELGGDSILSLQVVSRTRQAGLSLDSKDIFLHQTIASLAPVVVEAAPERIEQGPVTGALPLTPIQHWLFETNPESPEHFNQAMAVELAAGVDEPALHAAFAAVLAHHDALRMRFKFRDGGWQQFNAPDEQTRVMQRHDLSEVADADRRAAMDQVIAEVHASFDLGSGPLLKAVLFSLGAGDRPVLFLAVHHLVVDGVSWRILLEDLNTAYQQARRGEIVQLGPKTTSFRDWALRLIEHAEKGWFDAELSHWTTVADSCN
ncbi:MAG: condensation domain-containing protein, partial [Actinobacteria bacterium]|nr:condensation domain-containing protein [Actinomycetota bacterium]